LKIRLRLTAALFVAASLLTIAPAVSLVASPTHGTQRADDLPPGHERQFPGCPTCWEFGTP
jgi:hypothetical protein